MMSDHEWDLYLRGAEDPRTLLAEAQDREEDQLIEDQDDIEARGGPRFYAFPLDDEIPY